MLRKANQKRSLDDLVIQQGEFDWRSLFGDEGALTTALGEFDDTEDAHAAAVAAREEVVMEGADEADFGGDVGDGREMQVVTPTVPAGDDQVTQDIEPLEVEQEDPEEEGGTTTDYMLAFVKRDPEFFTGNMWR